MEEWPTTRPESSVRWHSLAPWRLCPDDGQTGSWPLKESGSVLGNAHGAMHFPVNLILELWRYADLWLPIRSGKCPFGFEQALNYFARLQGLAAQLDGLPSSNEHPQAVGKDDEPVGPPV